MNGNDYFLGSSQHLPGEAPGSVINSVPTSTPLTIGGSRLNKMPDNNIIVIDITGNSLRIRVSGQSLVSKMKSLGFSILDEFMVLSVNDDKDMLKIIKMLISEGALFLYGHGWYPSEVMEYYREQNIKFGKYKIIYWTDIDTYYIEEQ